MRRIFFLLIVVMVISEPVKAKKIKGQIITDDDTLDVMLKIPTIFGSQPSYERLQFKVIYYTADGNRQVMKPEDAKEIRFNYKSEQHRMLSRPSKNLLFTGLSSLITHVFLKLEVDGYLKLFTFFSTHSTGDMRGGTGNVTSTNTKCFQRGDGELDVVNKVRFKKYTMTYFKDCPDLVEKIENKEYRRRDIEEIVVYYNSNCDREE